MEKFLSTIAKRTFRAPKAEDGYIVKDITATDIKAVMDAFLNEQPDGIVRVGLLQDRWYAVFLGQVDGKPNYTAINGYDVHVVLEYLGETLGIKNIFLTRGKLVEVVIVKDDKGAIAFKTESFRKILSSGRVVA